MVDPPPDPRLLRVLQSHPRASPFPSRRSGDPYCTRAVDILMQSEAPESHALLAQLALENADARKPLGRAVATRLRVRMQSR